MNIVVLDGYTLNPGDLSWKNLESLGPCIVYDRSAPEEVARWRRIADESLVILRQKQIYSEDMIDTILDHLEEYRRNIRAGGGG